MLVKNKIKKVLRNDDDVNVIFNFENIPEAERLLLIVEIKREHNLCVKELEVMITSLIKP